MTTTLLRPDFRLFLDQIESEKLRAVAQAWDQARKGKTMPSFRALRPASIAAQLPIIWIYAYDRATTHFTGRLAGDRIVLGFGKSFRGIALKDVHTPEAFDLVHSVLTRVVHEPACFRSGGQLFRQGDTINAGERIILPLSDDGLHGDGVLGASDYQTLGTPTGPVDPIADNVRWFGLG